MQQVGKIYQMWEPGTSDSVRYFEQESFKRALGESGFRWQKSSAHSKLEIYLGGDILSDDRYKVGELDGNRIYVFSSSELERFLEEYPNQNI